MRQNHPLAGEGGSGAKLVRHNKRDCRLEAAPTQLRTGWVFIVTADGISARGAADIVQWIIDDIVSHPDPGIDPQFAAVLSAHLAKIFQLGFPLLQSCFCGVTIR